MTAHAADTASLIAAFRAWRRRWTWRDWLLVGTLLLVALIGIRYWPRAALAERFSSGQAYTDERGRLLRLTLARDDRYRLWLPLERMPPTLVEAVRLQEDQWFAWHPGVNPFSLVRGAFVTYVGGGNRQGGSTLTMQLARLMYRLNTRSPLGKARQIAAALWLEARYSKHDLLEAYLNAAPYGGNIEGVGAASLIYFQKPVDALTLPEMLTLAVLPQDPSRRLAETSGAGTAAVADPAVATLGPSLIAARDRLFVRWKERHPEAAEQDALFRLPMSLRPPTALPFLAPHAVEQLVAEQRFAPRRGNEVRSTIDLRLQKTLERQIAATLKVSRTRGVDNAAALLVDTRDLSVKALVGSADYFDPKISGQVNGSTAKRSPGSTLKPFIYALGIDQGLLHERTVLRDVPSAFGPFTPENFDGRFLGPVTATEALIRSRNIPAVYVASRLTNPTLYDFLRAAGVSRMQSEQHYGLALVLGGGEVTPQELATLYAMLGNRGVLRPLRLRADDPIVDGTRLLSPEASFMVMDMLRQNPRPDDAAEGQAQRLPVYWKTGTSWGFRDAWTAGIFGPYVLVVWLGHFDGSGNPALIGVEAAAPLFFRIADAIRAQDPTLAEPPQPPPSHLKQVEVCLASGDLPNSWCRERGRTWFIPGKSPIALSTVHRPVTIDIASGKPACPPYDPKTTRVEVYEYWRSDLAKVFADAGIPRRKPPPLPDCAGTDVGGGEPPHLTSPLRGAVYTLRQAKLGEEKIAFAASVDAGVSDVFWFVDDAFVGRASAGESLFWTAEHAGRHRVRVIDDRGRADERELEIAVVE